VIAPALSFHLVDRIEELDVERRARGRLAIPVEMSSFPACLVVEAIGQLASWAAMRRSDFARRPVAALAGVVRVLGAARPGSTLELSVAIRSCKSVAISYDGFASVGGVRIVELESAAGAMVAMTGFESPEEARNRFATLCAGGLEPRRFPDPAAFSPRVLSQEIDPGKALRAVFETPPPGELYADHFPRRPVYPATLLLDAQLRGALAVSGRRGAMRDTAADLVGCRVRNVKVRSFTPPGGRIDFAAEVGREDAEGDLAIEISATADGKRVSSASLIVPRA
jgi:3-hydroxymyristoyl/3-hydroxydecanoyl-(acyl carrier protein) dehydratase